MPLPTPIASYGGRLTHARSTLARLLLLLCCAPFGHAARVTAPASNRSSAYDQALRMREALEGRSQQQRTRRDYDRTLEAFRAVYHTDPRSTHADASAIAVAELMAAEGRLFEDRKLSLDAIGQYEFLRREYPASRYRFSALLTEGEIYDHDLGDRTAARSIFMQFLKQYPQNALADEARRQIRKSGAGSARPAIARASGEAAVARRNTSAADASSQGGSGRAHHNAVLDAALASQQSARAAHGQTSRVRTGSQAPAAAGPTASRSTTSRPPPTQMPATAKSNAPARQPGSTMVEQDLPNGPPANSTSSSTANRASSASSTYRPLASNAPATSRQSASQDDLTGPDASTRQISDANLNATPPPPRRGRRPLVTGVRHWSTAVYTRVAIDLDTGAEVRYEASRAPNPDRIFFDLHGVSLSPELIGKAVTVTDGGYLKRIRAAQFSGDVVRVVLDVSDVSEYSAFFLPNPSRLIIDIHGKATSLVASVAPVTSHPLVAGASSSGTNATASSLPGAAPVPVIARASSINRPRATTQTSAAPGQIPAHSRTLAESRHPPSDTLGDIATLDRQPNIVRATRSPTTAPVAASVADTTPAPQPGAVPAPAPELTTRHTHAAEAKAARAHGITPADTPASAIHAPEVARAPGSFPAGRIATPTATGERSMVRALGLKIGRIVVDAGHGGHDSGTLGPGGIEEKEVVLDVALRLGRLLKQRLGADVIYTRDDDTFIPLETRTAIANKAQADLFISVHANSSQDASARGVETYYLNFTSSADALEVAARENAVSDQSIHQLSDLVRKITLQDKISESREFAGDVEQSLYTGLEPGNPGLKDRGVKKAPFVVLIGANMPSILAEISFLTNPDDAHELRDGEYRQRIAESLYRGVAKYIGSLSGVRLAEGAVRPTGQ